MSTIVSLHAHPDDEALLTGGTLARAAAEGHRVVLVVATAGEAGLSSGRAGTALASRRTDELMASALALGVQRVELLGYADSGSSGLLPGGCFASLDPTVPAERVAQILFEEEADVLTGYDPAGGYGHPDHVQVHRVARRAARLAGTSLLEATLPREPYALAVRALALAGRVAPVPELRDPASAYTSRADITHRIDVRDHLDAKLAALAAHASQTGGGPRTIALLLRLPRPLQRRLLGHEYFVSVDPSPIHR